MRIEEQVVSLVSAKRLKELGVKQESFFWYEENPRPVKDRTDSELPHIPFVNKSPGIGEIYSAFTVGELGEMLPNYLNISIGKINNYWCCDYLIVGKVKHSTGDKTEAEARALMLIYLLENKLVNLLEQGEG